MERKALGDRIYVEYDRANDAVILIDYRLGNYISLNAEVRKNLMEYIARVENLEVMKKL